LLIGFLLRILALSSLALSSWNNMQIHVRQRNTTGIKGGVAGGTREGAAIAARLFFLDNLYERRNLKLSVVAGPRNQESPLTQ
jgi:hypothetical protein